MNRAHEKPHFSLRFLLLEMTSSEWESKVTQKFKAYARNE